MQLALGLDHRPDWSREAFIADALNRDALALVERWPDWNGPVARIHGPAGSGKSHLAAIFAERSGAEFVGPDALERAIAAPRDIVIDGLDAIRREHQEALFHLLNACRAANRSVLVTSRHPLDEWGIDIPDLKSRLAAAPAAAIGEPGAEFLAKLFHKQFADRQLSVEPGVVQFLLARIDRTAATVRDIVQALDERSIERSRAITKPLAGEVLREISEPKLC